MNETRFMELLGAYGADLSRWPEDDRELAESFLEGAPHRIKDIWESERTFDHLLALEKDGPASIALEAKVLAASPDHRSVRRPAGVWGRWKTPQWATGGAIAASLALGFAVGYAAEPEPEQTQTDGEYQMLSLTGGGAGGMFITAMNEPGN
jgi:hypothetical protein